MSVRPLRWVWGYCHAFQSVRVPVKNCVFFRWLDFCPLSLGKTGLGPKRYSPVPVLQGAKRSYGEKEE